MSVPAVVAKGATVSFSNKTARISDGKDVIAVAHKAANNLYVVNVKVRRRQLEANSVSAKMSLEWHRKMGHLNFGQLSKLPAMAIGVTKDLKEVPGKCETCILVKSTRASFSQRENRRPRRSGELRLGIRARQNGQMGVSVCYLY